MSTPRVSNSDLLDLLESCAKDREQEAHDCLAHTPEAFDAFMADAIALRAHAAWLRDAGDER